MKHCALCKKIIWFWQEWYYIKTPERIYHWDCGNKLDDEERLQWWVPKVALSTQQETEASK